MKRVDGPAVPDKRKVPEVVATGPVKDKPGILTLHHCHICDARSFLPRLGPHDRRPRRRGGDVLRPTGGDAATRGLGQSFGMALAALGVVAALLLWTGRTPGRSGFVVVGCLLAGAPVALGVTLTLARFPLAVIYPSLRDRGVPKLPSPQYAFPDAATRAAALAIVYNDYAKLDSLLHASPAPDLQARDERGVTLLGMAATAAIMDGGAPRDLDGVRFLLAAGARPRADDSGPGTTLIELVASAWSPQAHLALQMLLEAGLHPDTPMNDGRSVLFHPRLTPAAARTLLARGVDRTVRDNRGDASNWSPVTYQADLRRWATALVLLEEAFRRITAPRQDPSWRGC